MDMKIKMRMAELGLTQQSLAEKSGLSVPTVNKVVTGDIENLSIKNVRKVYACLKWNLLIANKVK